jgi:nucleotide-binding universal stress UspA family protein
MSSLGRGKNVIVCGTDLSERSLPAEEAAAALAGRLGERELWLAYVLEAPAKFIHARTRQDVADAARAELERRARERRTADLDVRAMVLEHHEKSVQAATDLTSFAEQREASLLVVSSQGHGATPLLRLGGTSERVALLAHVPVLVVRDAAPFVAWARGEHTLKVLVGVDQGRAAAAAVAWVKKLQAKGSCEVVVAEVYYPDDAARRYGVSRKLPLTREDPEVTSLLVRDIAARFGPWPEPQRVTYHAELGLGRLGDHLLGVAESHGADLIAVGAHQGRGMSRLSSVSSVVLHHGHASVACVPVPRLGVMPNVVPPLRSVLVATDLSSAGNHAVAYAYALCPGEGEVHLMHVVSEDELASDIEIAQRLRALVPEERAGVATRTLIVRHRNVARAICEASERLGVDAVCLASSTKTSRALGSVATNLLQEGRRPTLLVRAPLP